MRILIILFIVFTERAISFYIDPGTGSYLTQIIIAGALSILFYIKNITVFIKSAFQKIRFKR